MKQNNVKYLIIGAGISGLSFANCVKDQDYLIIEKEAEAGGYCRTIRKGDFVWDYAGHFFHFKTDEHKKMFIDNVEKDDIINKDKCTKILYKDKLIDYPFQTNIHELEKQEFIECLYDLFNKEEKENYDNFLDMLYGKFGKAIVEKFLKPYNEKLYACDLKNLDTEAMGRFFPYADLKQIINNMKDNKDSSYNNKFLYPRKGAGSFIDIVIGKNGIMYIEGRGVNQYDGAQRIEGSLIDVNKAFDVLATSSKYMNKFTVDNAMVVSCELSYSTVGTSTLYKPYYKFLIKYTETTEKNGQISQKNQVRYVFINAIDGSMTE